MGNGGIRRRTTIAFALMSRSASNAKRPLFRDERKLFVRQNVESLEFLGSQKSNARKGHAGGAINRLCRHGQRKNAALFDARSILEIVDAVAQEPRMEIGGAARRITPLAMCMNGFLVAGIFFSIEL